MERTQQLVSQLEEKQSNLREENADLKEKLSRADLAKDVLEQEKTHLTELFHKTEEEKEEYENDRKCFFLCICSIKNFLQLTLLILNAIFNQSSTNLPGNVTLDIFFQGPVTTSVTKSQLLF